MARYLFVVYFCIFSSLCSAEDFNARLRELLSAADRCTVYRGAFCHSYVKVRVRQEISGEHYRNLASKLEVEPPSVSKQIDEDTGEEIEVTLRSFAGCPDYTIVLFHKDKKIGMLEILGVSFLRCGIFSGYDLPLTDKARDWLLSDMKLMENPTPEEG